MGKFSQKEVVTMKKRFLIILVVTSVLVTVFVAGCTGGTTNTTSSSATASTATATSKVIPTSPPATASIPTASEFSNMWVRSHPNDTLVTAFTQSVNERGFVEFTGVTRGPYGRGDEINIFELFKDKVDAQQRYQQLVNQASLSGYMFDSRDTNTIQDKSTMVGWIPTDNTLVNTIIIGWNPPDDYGVGYYVQTIKMLSPNT